MSYTAYFNYTTGSTVYAKARPLDTGTWSNDVVSLSENGSSGDYSGTLDESTEYVLYVQSGGSPASSDTAVGEVAVSVADVSADVTAIKAKTDLIGTTAGTLTPIEGGTLQVNVGSTQSVAVVCNQDISAKTVQVVVETWKSSTDVDTVADGSISKDTTTATFSLTATMTTSERKLRLAVRDTTTNETYASILLDVTYDAQGD